MFCSGSVKKNIIFTPVLQILKNYSALVVFKAELIGDLTSNMMKRLIRKINHEMSIWLETSLIEAIQKVFVS